MSYNVQKLLDIAFNEVGYLEKETNSQLDDKTANAGNNNYTKYARDLAALKYFNGSKTGVAWCAVFVCWCFVQAFGKSAALKLLCQPSSGNCGAGCGSARNYFKSKKQHTTENPQPGDQIFFYSKDKTSVSHTGLVYKVDNTYVYTVEGNTSSASGVVANGGAVAKKKYKLTYDRIAGYGRPDYGIIEPKDDKEDASKESEEIITTPEANAVVKSKSGTKVNYRQKPSKLAARVKGMPTINHGEPVYIKTSDGTWAAVEYKGYRGYMMMEFLVQNSTDSEEEKEVQQPESTQEQVTYTTVKGDTLWKISAKFLGAGYKYKKIMKANGMKNTIIRPGMVLKIPNL